MLILAYITIVIMLYHYHKHVSFRYIIMKHYNNCMNYLIIVSCCVTSELSLIYEYNIILQIFGTTIANIM